MIELAEIDDENLAAVQAVTVSDRQLDFVGTVREALEEAPAAPKATRGTAPSSLTAQSLDSSC